MEKKGNVFQSGRWVAVQMLLNTKFAEGLTIKLWKLEEKEV